MTIMITILLALILLVLVVAIFMRRPVFGKTATGMRLERVSHSPNFRDGKFQNLHDTPSLTEGASIMSVMWKFFFTSKADRVPASVVPGTKTNLLALNKQDDILVWFGHSSYYFQIDGKSFLVDPVFSGNASPIAGSNKAFKGTDLYSAEDFPPFDYLVITHDHYDHLDYKTVKEVRYKKSKVLCGLGVGAHLESWGFKKEAIIEMDWNETIELGDGFVLNSLPARHFSGRKFGRNKTLWLSFMLQTPGFKLYLGGDSGYDDHFKAIGDQFGPIDLAILDNGQYNANWKYIHMHPSEVLQASKDLQAKRLLPFHSSKFALSTHAWKEPLTMVNALNLNKEVKILTPMIGEAVRLKDETQEFSKWWEEVT